MDNETIALTGLAAAPIITALVAAIGVAIPALPRRAYPIVAVAIGVAWNVAASAAGGGIGWSAPVYGVVAGLAERAIRRTEWVDPGAEHPDPRDRQRLPHCRAVDSKRIEAPPPWRGGRGDHLHLPAGLDAHAAALRERWRSSHCVEHLVWQDVPFWIDDDVRVALVLHTHPGRPRRRCGIEGPQMVDDVASGERRTVVDHALIAARSGPRPS